MSSKCKTGVKQERIARPNVKHLNKSALKIVQIALPKSGKRELSAIESNRSGRRFGMCKRTQGTYQTHDQAVQRGTVAKQDSVDVTDGCWLLKCNQQPLPLIFLCF